MGRRIAAPAGLAGDTALESAARVRAMHLRDAHLLQMVGIRTMDHAKLPPFDGHQ